MAEYLVKTPSEVPVGTPFSVNERCCFDPSLLEAGSIIGRFYRVVRCLGVGRAGAVYLCEVLEEEDSPPPLVAVKMLFRGVSEQGERNRCFVRFHREVDAIFRIAHPNVVSALQFICHEGQIGYSMDYVAGGTLAQHLSTRGAFSESEAIEMLDHLSRGLEAIHRAGVIHRDLKPDNILLTPELQPKISDFGVAFCGYGERLTAKGSIVGVIQYLSPEYLEKGVITRQGDVYALGALAYELVTGVPPFWGQGLCETIQAKVTGVVPDPRGRNSEVSDEFSHLIERALTTNVENRFRSAAEFNQALRVLARGRKTVQAEGLSDAIRESLPLLTAPVPALETADDRAGGKNGRPAPLSAYKFGLVVLVALIVFVGLRWLLGDPPGR